MTNQSLPTVADQVDVAADDSVASQTRLAIVILNYRTPALTIDALTSIASGQDLNDVQVVVVDNRSEDGSGQQIQTAIEQNEWNDWCRLVQSPTNDGFSAGNNVGVRAVHADAYLLLNSDTIVRPGALDRLQAEMDRNPDVGMFSPRLEWLDGTAQVSCFRFFRPATELVRCAATGFVTRLFNWADVAWQTNADGGHDRCSPDWTSFACVLIRREVFETVGLMDDGYFMYYDDIDFCQTANQNGIVLLHCPQARVVHLRGGSSAVKQLKAKRKRRPRYYFAARSRYYAKHFGGLGLLLANLFWSFGFVISGTRHLITGRPPRHCQHEWRDIWTNFFRPLSGPNR
ncbi:glycosyltransferase family 2 protein [Stieleria sp. TO1_6]|uniref:glycosyltransferase family 2 protein n=1 Tax=Stieleria tagensis TaxID=2956795 RepID=UPI00209A8B05|nr:glycosyltransferase family 2 protein [Stieleria tagensis]MCO8120676.1 glycosyltransferase family 2 protein [Stieleria tagensis]